MTHHVIEIECRCQSCTGTGLYVGIAERDGAAVVCHTCKGTGCQHIKLEYDDFEGRQPRENVSRVYQANPGICIGTGNGHRLEDFGGLPYDDWLAGKPFIPGTENRRSTCPTWFYQCAGNDKKPQWDECFESLGRTFSDCPSFCRKQDCWARWDREFGDQRQ